MYEKFQKRGETVGKRLELRTWRSYIYKQRSREVSPERQAYLEMLVDMESLISSARVLLA